MTRVHRIANEHSADGKPISRVLTGALQALARAIHQGGAEPSRHEVVRSSVRVLCVFARQDRVPQERLLAELKAMMNAPHALDGVPLERRDTVRSDVARLAIESYHGFSH